MNLILSDIRSRFLIQNVSSLIFIKLNGPPLMRDPNDYIKKWLQSHRCASDTLIRTASQKSTVTQEDPVWKFS